MFTVLVNDKVWFSFIVNVRTITVFEIRMMLNGVIFLTSTVYQYVTNNFSSILLSFTIYEQHMIV